MHLSNLEAISRSENGKHWRTKKKHNANENKSNDYCLRGHYKDGNKHCKHCMRKDTVKPNPPDNLNWRQYYNTNYLVSDCGQVWSNNHHKILKPGTNKPGYLYVCLRIDGKSSPRSIHRMVAETFIGKIDKGRVVDHIDRDKKNNKIGNLRIISHSENMRDLRKKD